MSWTSLPDPQGSRLGRCRGGSPDTGPVAETSDLILFFPGRWVHVNIAQRQIEVNVHVSIVDDMLMVRRECLGFDARLAN
jgi:hypothetical protein